MTISFSFTYPESLKNAEVSVCFSESNIRYFFGQEELPSESIPDLWHEIYLLFTPDGEILSAKKTDTSTVIEIRHNEATRTYTLNNEGKLKEIKSETIKIDIKEG